jgi:hypothetical protein
MALPVPPAQFGSQVWLMYRASLPLFVALM